ncbi:hypothetical protein [Salinibacterium sp. ZJ450]|uniref:hypothetical protein n=1 Tax=Salinibacterium sp. ZJ450 TaxID=2708338 RepID=UPI001420AC45|nr:hypothetical protein [Salinibacterium sp. ZJ450]
MNISKKWGAAAAGALSLALLGGGVTAANAAPGDPVDPQPVGSAAAGSKGGFFLFDSEAVRADVDPNRVFTRDEYLFAAADDVDFLAETNPAATRPVSGATPFTEVYRFLAEKNDVDLMGGLNTWNAYANDSAAGPNGGTLTPEMTLDSFGVGGPGGIADDIAAGGSFWYGIGYTYSNGVQVAGVVYREINIEAGTGNYTVSPMVLEQAVAFAPDFANFAATAGATAEIRDGNLNIDATVANANKTVDVWAEGTGKVATVTLGADGTATNTVPAGIVDGTRFALVEDQNGAADGGEVEVAWIATSTFDWDDLKPTTGAANEINIPNPAAGNSVVTIDAGTANANQTFKAIGWSTETDLGNVTTDGSGIVTIDAAALGNGDHTIALFDGSDQVVAWGTFTLVLDDTDSETDLTVKALTSNKFALESVNTAANLGATKRGTTTTEVDLGAFTVVDDRDLLPGWTLSAAAADFVNSGDEIPAAAGDVINKAALGIAPKAVSTLPVGVSLAPAQVAGSGAGSALFAEGNANSSTFEAGTQFDAGLTFAVPASAKKGTYTSKLTLTLVTK